MDLKNYKHVHCVGIGGIAAAITKMCLGNNVGFKFTKTVSHDDLFCPDYGTILLEVAANAKLEEVLKETGCYELGETTAVPSVVCGASVAVAFVVLPASTESAITSCESAYPLAGVVSLAQ